MGYFGALWLIIMYGPILCYSQPCSFQKSSYAHTHMRTHSFPLLWKELAKEVNNANKMCFF